MYLMLCHLDIAVETRSADIGVPSDMVPTKFGGSSVNASSRRRGAYRLSHAEQVPTLDTGGLISAMRRRFELLIDEMTFNGTNAINLG